MTLRRLWLEWRRDGRQRCLRTMAREDHTFQAALDTYHAAAEAHAKDLRDAEAAFKTLQGTTPALP
jgi:hypothetical protein